MEGDFNEAEGTFSDHTDQNLGTGNTKILVLQETLKALSPLCKERNGDVKKLNLLLERLSLHFQHLFKTDESMAQCQDHKNSCITAQATGATRKMNSPT